MTKASTKPFKNEIVVKKGTTISKVKLTAKQQEILNAIATLKARNGEGKSGADRDRVLRLVGYNKNKGAKAFANAITILRKHKGLITFDTTTMDLTEDGKAMAEVSDALLPTRDQQVDQLKNNLTKGGQKAKKLLEALRDGKKHTRVSVADTLGYDNAKVKSMVNMMSLLKGENLIEYVKDDNGEAALQLAEWILNEYD